LNSETLNKRLPTRQTATSSNSSGKTEARRELICDKYDSELGRKTIRYSWNMFSRIIEKLEIIYNVRPFNQQSVQSLVEMHLLVGAFCPRSIVELGAGTRSSTIALATAAAGFPRCEILSIDINPGCFSAFASKYFPELAFAPVNDVQMNIAELAHDNPIRVLPGPILVLLDAHDDDIPGVKVFDTIRDHVFPLPVQQLIAVHDCTVLPSDANVNLPPRHVRVQHISGRTVVGYGEVVPLVNWMNENLVDFCRPGDELSRLGFRADNSSLIYFFLP